MEHNSLTGIACARPIIYAEGLFAPCTLEDGKFVPEEGLSQQDLWSVLNGEFFKSGSDLVEDFAVSLSIIRMFRRFFFVLFFVYKTVLVEAVYGF